MLLFTLCACQPLNTDALKVPKDISVYAESEFAFFENWEFAYCKSHTTWQHFKEYKLRLLHKLVVKEHSGLQHRLQVKL